MVTDNAPLPSFSFIGLNTTHTCALFFPSPVLAWQQSSEELISCTASAGNKLLLVKAGKEQFRQTILQVHTEDGSHYNLVTRYTGEISRSFYVMNSLYGQTSGFHSDKAATQSRIRRNYLPVPGLMAGQQLKLELAGSYIFQDKVFYQLDLYNYSTEMLDPFEVKAYYRKSGWALWPDNKEETDEPLLNGRNDFYLEPYSSRHLVLEINRPAWHRGHELVIEATSLSGKLLYSLVIPHLEMADNIISKDQQSKPAFAFS